MAGSKTAVCTALHIVKGAVTRSFNIPTGRTTLGIHFASQPYHGRLTVSIEKWITQLKPQGLVEEEVKLQLPDRIKEAQRLINSTIQANTKIESSEINRADAEKEYGDAIYDWFPVPPTVQQLRLLRVLLPASVPQGEPYWNINCCPTQHLPSTGSLTGIELSKYKFRSKNSSLELNFKVNPLPEK